MTATALPSLGRPVWATTSTLDGPAEAVEHVRGVEACPGVSMVQRDLIAVDGGSGEVTWDRGPVQFFLDSADSVDIDTAREIYAALGELLAAYDA